MADLLEDELYANIVPSPDEMNPGDLVERVRHPSAGGLATFRGHVRASNEGRDVEFLEYDCYESMALQRMVTILRDARERWNNRGPLRGAVAHRVGRVAVSEVAVAVAISTPHRAEAMEACRYTIDELKTRVPIWKKERFESGETWVENPGSTGREEST